MTDPIVLLPAMGAIAALSVYAIYRLLEAKMGAFADALETVETKLDEAQGEIVGALEDLKAQLDAKGTLDDADKDAIDRITTKATALADIVPNVPVDEDPSAPVEQVEDPAAPVTPPGETAEAIENGEDIPDPSDQ